MRKHAVVLFTLIIAVAAVGVPIWLAGVESERQAYEAESKRALGYARDVLVQADEAGRQAWAGIHRLAAQHRDAPCSPASIDAMREIDLLSSYVQAVGYVLEEKLLCSSIAVPNRVLALGPPDYVNTDGASVRRNVRFAFAPEKSFIVFEVQGFAAIVLKQRVFDTASSEADVALALMSLDSPVPLNTRGRILPEWLGRLGNRSEAVFVDQDHLVAVTRSPRFPTAAVAAVPLRYVNDRARDAAWRLLPVGLVSGVALSLAILYLGRQQMALPAALRAALRRKEFFLVYQPVVDLRDGRCIGVEALLRWQRPTGEVVMPDVFIPIAEESGLIVRLTQEVFRLLCREAGSYLATHPHFHVAVNVAPADFQSATFLPSLQSALLAMRASPANLILEITERVVLDPGVARRGTSTLRSSGYAVALDDFGTGYSSLSYLESLELDYLKIDRSFIKAIGTGAPTSQVVTHIIRIGKDLGLRMIAEGVENSTQAEFLRAHGVQFAQGWYFGKPAGFAEIIGRVNTASHLDAHLAW